MPNDEDKDLDILQLSERDIDKKLQDFSDLLEEIDKLDDKKRALWKDIYTNAVSDRQNSYVIFTQLFRLIGNRSTEYAVHGKTLTGCVERMSKANDQLIKLAELIARASAGTEAIDSEEMFAQIEKNNKGR